MNNPLASIVFLKLPKNFSLSHKHILLDENIPLPVQKKIGEETFSIETLSQEQILSGILTVLAYDTKNENADYYRKILLQARPDIKRELSEAAILKAKNEDFEIAEEIFASLRGLDPNDMRIVLNSALFFDERANSYRASSLNDDADAYDEAALSFYKKAMTSEPALPDAFFNCGFFYLKKYDYAKAKDCFETFVALTFDMKDKNENDDYKLERAQEIINNINNQNMDDAHFKKAYDLISRGEEKKGIEEIKKFLQTNQKVWNAWFMLGWGLRRLQRFEDATQAFLQSLECAGGDAQSDTFNELALCFIEQNKLKEAKQMLTKALSLSGDDTKIISNLGFLSLREGKIEEAKKFFQTVLAIDPKDKIAKTELERLV